MLLLLLLPMVFCILHRDMSFKLEQHSNEYCKLTVKVNNREKDGNYLFRPLVQTNVAQI